MFQGRGTALGTGQGTGGEVGSCTQTLTTVCTQINDSISMKKLAAHFNAQRALMSNGH